MVQGGDDVDADEEDEGRLVQGVNVAPRITQVEGEQAHDRRRQQQEVEQTV